MDAAEERNKLIDELLEDMLESDRAGLEKGLQEIDDLYNKILRLCCAFGWSHIHDETCETEDRKACAAAAAYELAMEFFPGLDAMAALLFGTGDENKEGRYASYAENAKKACLELIAAAEEMMEK